MPPSALILFATIVWLADLPRAAVGKFRVEEYQRGWRLERRLVHDGTMIATQIPAPYLMPHDAPIPFGSFSGWDALLMEGSVAAFDPRHEPLSYYHRSGPVGAMFHELRTRRGGTDARAPVGVVGLNAGTEAAYALPGQRVTFYETDPALRRLVADTDGHFSYIADARRRGAAIDIRIGDGRECLARDADRKFALLLVGLYDKGFDPGDRLTLEAVRLYLDRVAPDGLVALHVSNKEFRLEPVVARIADELKLVGRIWNDNGERRPGKTASSWVVLARDRQTLGGLDSPHGDLLKKYHGSWQLRHVLMAAHEDETKTVKEFETRNDPRAEAVAWLKKKDDPESLLLADLVDKFGLSTTLNDAMLMEVGHAFRPIEAEDGVGIRRDGDKGWPAAIRPKKD